MHAKVEQRALMRIYIDDDFLYSYIVTQRVARERFTKQQTTTRFQIFDSRVRGERRVKRERREICVFVWERRGEKDKNHIIFFISSFVSRGCLHINIYIYIYKILIINKLISQLLTSISIGKRRYDRKQSGYGGQTKPVFHKKAKTTKKIVLKLTCNTCKRSCMHKIKRCKTFEIGGDSKNKGGVHG